MPITLKAKAQSTKTVMLQIDPVLHQRIKFIAKDHNMSAAAVMRQILEQGIQQVEEARA
jgi:predicted DNA-binding protein